MKKLVFMFVAVVAISFASCGNKTNLTLLLLLQLLLQVLVTLLLLSQNSTLN